MPSLASRTHTSVSVVATHTSIRELRFAEQVEDNRLLRVQAVLCLVEHLRDSVRVSAQTGAVATEAPAAEAAETARAAPGERDHTLATTKQQVARGQRKQLKHSRNQQQEQQQ